MSPKAKLAKDRRTANNGALSKLQHRHYAAIASIIAKMPPKELTRDDVAQLFAYALVTNPRFDIARFIAACKPTKVSGITFAGAHDNK